MLRRITNFIDENSMKLLYLCLVQSHLDYCCEIWGLRYNMQTDRIIKLQKRAARIILKCNMYKPSKEMFAELKWLPFNLRVTYFKCVFMFKCLKGLSSNFYCNTFKFACNSHNFNTRFSANNNVITAEVHTECFKHSLFYSSIIMWNNLPSDIKQSQSLSVFKKKVKIHLFKSQTV